jgi:hypothetical protein
MNAIKSSRAISPVDYIDPDDGDTASLRNVGF